MGDIQRRLLIAGMATALALSPFAAGGVAADGLAVDDPHYSVLEDGTLTVPTETGVLANDTGGSAVLCVAAFDAAGLQGTLTDDPVGDGSFAFEPPDNFHGLTTFTYSVATKAGEACPAAGEGEGTATVTITVTPVNDAPTAVADFFAALANRTLNVNAPGVLGNDSDVDGDSLTAVKVNNPAHGTLTLAGDGGFSYTPADGYTGPDAFSYRAFDGQATSPVRVVNLTVSAIPPTPTPTPVPTPTPTPTASPEPSPTESPSPSDSGLSSPSPGATSPLGSPSPEPTPAGPVAGEGGPPILALGALGLLVLLLGVAGVYFVRSQRDGGDAEPEDVADDDPGEGPIG